MMKTPKTGRKKPLSLDEVRAIRTILSSLKYSRNRVLFEVAIASSLRESDVLGLRVSDVLTGNEIRDTIRVTPRKTARTTGTTIAFQLTPYAKQALREHIEESSLSYGDFLFTRQHSRTKPTSPLTKRAFLNLLKTWVSSIGLNPELYGTHSLRRTRPALVYAETKNLRACQIQLGNASITTTQKYLGIEEEEALEVFRGYQI
jgi:integrase